MELDRVLADAQFLGNGTVPAARGQKGRHLHLPRSQTLQAGSRAEAIAALLTEQQA